ALDRLAQKISEFNASTEAVRVIGHTSRTGTGQINQTLSLERAEVVVEALRDRGLSHKFVAEGNGFETPLPDFSPKDPRQQRTEIRLVRIN
ncbi:MAG: OmpA family protein, partial [Prochloraceae cyanobacterium]